MLGANRQRLEDRFLLPHHEVALVVREDPGFRE